jgi:hypothetical protein
MTGTARPPPVSGYSWKGQHRRRVILESRDVMSGRSAGSPQNPLRDPTRGRSAGTPVNPLRDPTRSRAADEPDDRLRARPRNRPPEH